MANINVLMRQNMIKNKAVRLNEIRLKIKSKENGLRVTKKE